MDQVKGMPHNARYYFRMANEAAYSGNLPNALDLFDQAISFNPNLAPIWHERGDCLDRMDRCEEAIASYDTALRLDPANAETWFNKGLVLKKIGQGNEASHCMNHGIDLALGR